MILFKSVPFSCYFKVRELLKSLSLGKKGGTRNVLLINESRNYRAYITSAFTII